MKWSLESLPEPMLICNYLAKEWARVKVTTRNQEKAVKELTNVKRQENEMAATVSQHLPG